MIVNACNRGQRRIWLRLQFGRSHGHAKHGLNRREPLASKLQLFLAQSLVSVKLISMAFRTSLLLGLAAQSVAVRFDVDASTRGKHFQKEDRIAIIGAGPAGVHMASRLKQMGYTKTTIFERSDRVGGKSLTLYLNRTGECTQEKDETGKVDTASCVAHDMGTCFLHNGYHTIRDLVDEYDLTPVAAPEGRAMFSHFAKSSQSMPDFVTSSIMDGIKKGKIKVPWYAATTKLKVLCALITAVKQYNELHASLFGEVEFSMPSRPNEEVLKKIDMTFAEFLETNGLHALSGFLMFAHAAQGYGYVKSIPALYGLWWISPELLNGYVQMSFREQLEKFNDPSMKNGAGRFLQSMRGRWVRGLVAWLVGGKAKPVKRTTTMLPEGYEKIWTTMAEKDGLNIRFGVHIEEQGIDRQLDQPNAPVVIQYTQDGEKKSEEFDFLIYSGPHAHAKTYVKDIATKEERIFSRLRSFVLATTLYISAPVKGYTDEKHQIPIMYAADKMADASQDGTWYADRYDDLIFAQTFNTELQPRVGYQFYENYGIHPSLRDTDRSPLRKHTMKTAPEVLHHFQQELAKQQVTNVTILRQYPWPYFHHFGQAAIQEGMPWDLFEMQGERKTWWIGASASFESVHDVTNYNMELLSKYMGAEFQAGRIK